MEHNRGEKYEGREIRIGAGVKCAEREHGKLYRWFDNFWYHHKWATIAALVILLVLTVCIFQMCGREEQGDITVVAAGPYGFVTNEMGLNDLKKCLSTYIPEDYNGNGMKDITIYNYTIFSEDEMKELAGRVDENGNPAGTSVDSYQNSQQLQSFSQYLTTGDTAVLFLTPWLAEQYAKNTGALVDFEDILGYSPENGVSLTRDDGESVYYGVKLSETALWCENSAVRENLPEDTVICMMVPGVLGNNADVTIYNHSLAFVKALVK